MDINQRNDFLCYLELCSNIHMHHAAPCRIHSFRCVNIIRKNGVAIRQFNCKLMKHCIKTFLSVEMVR